MNRKIKFSFGTGLKGNVNNSFDFDVLYEIFTLDDILLHSQNTSTIEFSSFSTDEEKVKIKVTQSRKKYQKIDEFEVEVNKSTTVLEVKVIPSQISLNKSNTFTFTAEVIGRNNPPQDVNWNVNDNTSSSTIISNGLLTIGSDENATSITITATSIFDTTKSGTASVAISSIASSSDYLRMFSNNPNNITINTVKSEFPELDDYWYWIQFNGGAPQRSPYGAIANIRKEFYNGITDLRSQVGQANISLANDVYRAQLFKLAMDTAHNNLTLPEIATYNTAMLYLTSIGITDSLKRHEIYLTYQLKMVNVIRNAASTGSGNLNWNNMLSSVFDSIASHLDRNKCFATNWLTWEPVLQPPAGQGFTGGLAWQPITGSIGANTIQSNIIGRIAIAPEATLFNPNTGSWGNGEHIAFPFRWSINEYTATTGWPTIKNRWSIINGSIDPLTTQYKLSYLEGNTTEQEAFAVLDVLIHELGHALSNYNQFINPGQPSKCLTTSWLTVGGWDTSKNYLSRYGQEYWQPDGTVVTTYYNYPGPAKVGNIDPPISIYGGTHPSDDWAECYACYVLNKPYFQAMFPNKYQVMNNYLNSLQDLKLNRL